MAAVKNTPTFPAYCPRNLYSVTNSDLCREFVIFFLPEVLLIMFAAELLPIDRDMGMFGEECIERFVKCCCSRRAVDGLQAIFHPSGEGEYDGAKRFRHCDDLE